MEQDIYNNDLIRELQDWKAVRELYLLKHNIRNLLKEAIEKDDEYWRGKEAGIREMIHLIETLSPDIGLKHEQFNDF